MLIFTNREHYYSLDGDVYELIAWQREEGFVNGILGESVFEGAITFTTLSVK